MNNFLVLKQEIKESINDCEDLKSLMLQKPYPNEHA
jgi:hypothetical protein